MGVQELAVGKMEATKLIKNEMEEIITQNRSLEERLLAREHESKAYEEKVTELQNRYLNILTEYFDYIVSFLHS